jgi:integrase/recombinase XerD
VSFSQFIRERRYLSNVAPTTLEWYGHAFKWLHSEAPDADELKDAVIRMREKGLRATGCNSAIRAINAYLKWSGSPLKIPQLKEPQFIPPTFTAPQIKLLVQWRPKGFYERRVHLLVLLLLDTGCRVSEALNIRVADLDLDNLLVTLYGKGRKQRRVPFSFELRKALYRHVAEYIHWPDRLLFATVTGGGLGRRNVLRDVKRLCKRLGITPPGRTVHAMRHSFAVNYLRRGGSVFHLQKVLGHSSLEMSRRYANLSTEDLSAVHEKISLLSSR